MTTPVGRCGQCNQPLPPRSPSLYFCDFWHQKLWYMAQLKTDGDRRIAEPACPPSMFTGAA